MDAVWYLAEEHCSDHKIQLHGNEIDGVSSLEVLFLAKAENNRSIKKEKQNK